MATPSKVAPSAPVTVKKQVVKVHVKFTLNTPDGKRRVIFDLEKNTADDGVVTWKINFQLFERERKSDTFGDAIVDLEVEVDSKLNNKAQAMFDNGMTPPQAAFASGPAADTAKDPDVDDETKADTVQKTVKK
jgi:hypothetical protein